MKNVFEESLDRIRNVFEIFDNPVVLFSGGKDSTVVLNLTLQVAKEKNRLPLKVIFYDEEAIHPNTIEYIERVRKNKDIDFHWLCVPTKHRNGCSRSQPFWIPWNPAEKDIWVRPLPKGAVSTVDHIDYLSEGKERREINDGYTTEEVNQYYCEGKNWSSVCLLFGIRCQESTRRRNIIAKKFDDPECYLFGPKFKSSKCRNGWPIYDWNTQDVWKSIYENKWDYSKAYDHFTFKGLAPHQQRVCQPFSEEAVANVLDYYKECFPNLFEKMVNRVEGANTAAIYSKTSLYGRKLEKPNGITWKAFILRIVDQYKGVYKNQIIKTIKDAINVHNKYSKVPLPEEQPDKHSGLSWKGLTTMVIRGDFKGRRMQQMTTNAMLQQLSELNTLEEVNEFKKQREQTTKQGNRKADDNLFTTDY